jgi:phosphorylcholine phosphatase
MTATRTAAVTAADDWPGLQHWPASAAAALTALIRRHAHSGAFAIFDADNTSYRHDLVGALLPFMEMKGALTRDTLNPALKLIPFKDSPSQLESLNSYYLRLGEIDDQVGYPWAAQIFSGFTLGQLKGYLDEMLAHGKAIASNAWVGDSLQPQMVEPPQLLKGQQELYQALTRHGIEVFVVSAASEELVRMVLADPKYGYHVKPENVIGVSLLLKDPVTGEVTTARKLIAQQRYQPSALMQHELTHTLWAPLPWYEGKQAAIHTYIHPWKKPILVAGDTPHSDGPMLFRGPDTAQGAQRLFVCRSEQALHSINAMRTSHAAAQTEHGLPVTAHDNWLIVTPDDIA